jgi:hypothetical protein
VLAEFNSLLAFDHPVFCHKDFANKHMWQLALSEQVKKMRQKVGKMKPNFGSDMSSLGIVCSLKVSH